MKNKKILKITGLIFGIITILFIIGIVIMSFIMSKFDEFTEGELSYYFDKYEVSTENLTSYVKGTGEITSFNIQTLDIPSYAKIKENYVNDGDIVSKNQKLMKINSAGYIGVEKAPIAGMFFKVDNGGDFIYQIYDTANLGVEINVNEKDVAFLKVGQKANVKISALNKEIDGVVSYVSKLPVNGKFKVKVKIAYFDELRFGYGVNVKINILEKQNVIVIPYQNLYMDNDNRYYVIKEEYMEEYYNSYMNDTIFADEYKTYVEIGVISNNKVEIISGLSVGDKIIEWAW